MNVDVENLESIQEINFEEIFTRESAKSFWDVLCSLIDRHQNTKATEDVFQKDIEKYFEELGWERGTEIVPHENRQIGAGNLLVSDIMIHDAGQRILAVELKRPCVGLSDSNEKQLMSYMLQWKLRFGLLIGASIQLYYNELAADSEPRIAQKLDFVLNDERGIELIAQIIKISFSVDRLQEYCKQILNKTTAKSIPNISDTTRRRLPENNDERSIADTSASLTNREFWDKFNAYCEERNLLPAFYHYSANNTKRHGVPIERYQRDYRVFVEIDKSKLHIGIEVYNDAAFTYLQEKLTAIESHFGEKLRWSYEDGKLTKSIFLLSTEANPYLRDSLPENFNWFVERLLQLRESLQSVCPEAFGD